MCCTSTCSLGRFLKTKSYMAHNTKLLSSHHSRKIGEEGKQTLAVLSRLYSGWSCSGNRPLQYPFLPAVLILCFPSHPAMSWVPGGWREKGWQHWVAGLERMWQSAMSAGCGQWPLGAMEGSRGCGDSHYFCKQVKVGMPGAKDEAAALTSEQTNAL